MNRREGLLETLEVIYEVLGNRQTVILKEMTKVYERVWRGAFGGGAQDIAERRNNRRIYPYRLMEKPRDPGPAKF